MFYVQHTRTWAEDEKKKITAKILFIKTKNLLNDKETTKKKKKKKQVIKKYYNVQYMSIVYNHFKYTQYEYLCMCRWLFLYKQNILFYKNK